MDQGFEFQSLAVLQVVSCNDVNMKDVALRAVHLICASINVGVNQSH
jgi:hypothetical protein